MDNSFPPSDYVLLQSIHDTSEAHFLCGLLESNGIIFHVDSKRKTSANLDMDALIQQFDIYVKDSDVVEARRLLQSCEEDEKDYEFEEFKERQEKSKRKAQRSIVPLFISVVFFGVANLPMMESATGLKYLLFGISLYFFSLLIFSFYKGDNR